MVSYLKRARLREELLRELTGYQRDPGLSEAMAHGVARAMDRYEPELAAFAKLPPVTEGARAEFATHRQRVLEALESLTPAGLTDLSDTATTRLPMVRGDRFRGYLHRVAASQLAVNATGATAEYVFGPSPKLVIVGDNIVRGAYTAVKRLGGLHSGVDVRTRMVRAYLGAIALHEATHRVQDRAVPWIGTSFDDASRAADGPVTTAEHVPPGGQYRDAHDYLKALSCLLEGHAEWVGKQVATRNRPEVLGHFLTDALGDVHDTGNRQLNLYGHGLRFVENVVAEVGIDGFNEVWRGPGKVPSVTEIHHPRRWLDRVKPRPGR